eukprot:Nitzschia sp. Nitz4//scaffold366_size23882//2073//6107//NITZ4_008438-RA/size23882-processed-gene-0.30-mRNA-1//-1//CDS//3329549299//6151//frame0
MCTPSDTMSPATGSQGDGKSKSQESGRTPNMLENASAFSKLFFQWPFPLLKLGLERPLEEADLPEIMKVDSSRFCRDDFMRIWEAEMERNPVRPSLHWALVKNYLTSLWYIQPLLGLAAAAKIVQAVALGYLIQSFETGEAREGYKWASLLVLSGVVILFEHHHVFLITWRKGMQLRASCVAAIYAKSLRLSSTHHETNSSTGKIMNLASNDVERFLQAALFVNHLFWAPLQAIAILVVGCFILGPAFAAGFGLLVAVFVPFQFRLSRKFAFFRSQVAAITDQRVNFVSQAINGARVMKMSGYEWRFLDRIRDIRTKEVAQIAKANRLKASNETLFFSSNVIISLTIFLTHVFTGGTLRPRDVFTVFTLINILQLEVTKHVSMGVMAISEVSVSIRRIQAYLEFPELPRIELPGHGEKVDGPTETESDSETNHVPLSLSNVNCFWNDVRRITHPEKEEEKEGKAEDNGTDDESSTAALTLALSNVSVDFPRGQLTCIIGPVGSGKSALVQALVGELPVHSGIMKRSYSTLAYAAQDPWIMDGTVQSNITMGVAFNQEWYDRVVDSCGLRPDFQQFLNGDQTVVGDRGVQCSGGQRARIGLARALYRDAEVLIVDDPLSAVDARVGRKLFNEALLNMGVKRGKCVILSTHQHQYVNDQRCVLVQNGKIEHIGSYADCVTASNGKLKAHAADEGPVVDMMMKEQEKLTSTNVVDKTDDESPDKAPETKDLVVDDTAEKKTAGVVHMDTYKDYARAMGGIWIAFALLGLFTVTQASSLTAVAMMGRWAERPKEGQDDWDIVGLVIGLGISVAVLASIRSMLSFELTIGASRKLHDNMTHAVLRAKISFFDTNPLGRILNRFSADVGSNDDLLPQTLFDFVMILFIVLGAVATTVTVLPFALLAIPPLLWYFVMVRRIFVTSTRELKRLEGMARSPIFAMLSEALSGIATIRSNDSKEYFVEKFEKVHDAHTRAFFSFIASSRWVGFRMDSIMFLLMSFVSFMSVIFQQQGWFSIDPSILGLSISMLVQLAGIFQWCIRQSAEVVNLMVSVERVLGFGKLEPEAPLEVEDDKVLDPEWPQFGKIAVDDLAVRYRPVLPRALDGATFTIPAGARVGIVGRTGSGKSTVVQTLFRLLEAEDGGISIDDVNIAHVGLHRLRTKISVIPQVPTLFSGCTVRENLDLFGIHDDAAIAKALEDAHLGETIDSLPKGMHSMVSEGGSNFSVGQRQLLCLARAILSKNKILVLDEATASVDMRTDQLLHETLDESFGDATIVAVAHRLDTVIEHDFIAVLGKGKVLEFGSPAKLLRANGHFSKMVEDTGESMAQELTRRAFAKESKSTPTEAIPNT